MIKSMELLGPSCLTKAADDEPIFVLRAKDVLAPAAIRLWASMARNHHEQKKIDEALGIAIMMETYRKKIIV